MPARQSEQEAMQEKPRSLRFFQWGWTSFVVLATSVPYLVFWLRTPPDHRYSWILPPYPQDSFGYMAWSQQAAHGSVLFQIKYTALPHSPFLFNPFFLICGWISRVFGCEIGIVHWALKAVGVVLFLAVFYAYTDWLELNRLQSILASVFVGIASGFGGILVFLGLIDQGQIVALVNQGQFVPADLWMPEVSTYSSLLWNALFPYSLTLIILTIYCLDRGTREDHKIYVWLGGFAVGVLALIHPYAVPMLLAYATIITSARRGFHAISLLCRFFLASFPFVLYVVLVSILQPLLSQHSASGEMHTRSFVGCLLGFGFPLLICAVGVTIEPGRLARSYWQLLLWFLLSLGFAYLPFWFQRKFLFGAQIPLCILAGIYLDFILSFSWVRRRHCALVSGAIALALLLVSTPVCQLLYASREVRHNANSSYYISDDLFAGLKFLKERTQPNEVVFATWDTSRLIPAFSGNTVLWGHWAMSVDLQERLRWSAQLFNANPNWRDKQRSNDFWGSGIGYIFADGDLKKSIEQNPDMWQVILSDAEKVFENSCVIIYKHHDAHTT